MKFFHTTILFSVLFCFSHLHIHAQVEKTLKDQPEWLIPSDTFNKKRFTLLASSVTAAYAATLYGLDKLWYADYPRGSFKWINDIREWQQVDKAGHMVTPYLEARYFMQMLRWTGVEHKKAAIYAGLTAFMFQNTIEIFDGHSEQWGASAADIGANFIGAALMTSQELLWKEQRMMLKVMPSFVDYEEEDLKERAKQLYGESFIQRFIKDYNSINVWLSINPSSFAGKNGRFSWINVAVGYGAGGMFGGYENIWEDQHGVFHNRNDVQRYRRFMLSPDIDFSRIPTRSRYIRILLDLMNIVKVPLPALEINTKGEVVFHPLL